MFPAFEKSEEKRVNSEIESFAKELESETQKEKQKQEKNIEALNKRKDVMLKENKKKLQVSLVTWSHT